MFVTSTYFISKTAFSFRLSQELEHDEKSVEEIYTTMSKITPAVSLQIMVVFQTVTAPSSLFFKSDCRL